MTILRAVTIRFNEISGAREFLRTWARHMETGNQFVLCRRVFFCFEIIGAKDTRNEV